MRKTLLRACLCICLTGLLLSGCGRSSAKQTGDQDSLRGSGETSQAGAAAQGAAKFGQQEAAIAMSGGLSGVALARASKGDDTASPLTELADDADAYMEAAGFSEEAQKALSLMLTEAPSDAQTWGVLWNAVNSKLATEADGICSQGKEWFRFGSDLTLVSLAMVGVVKETTGADKLDERQANAVRTLFASPMGQDLFSTGRRLPLPDLMQARLDSAEGADTTTPSGCQTAARDLITLFGMVASVAKKGPATLDRYR